MNEFTREELNFLQEMIGKYHHADLTIWNSVFNKIQSMIDAYCEHVSNGNVQALLCNPPLYTFTCKKCGKGYR